MDSDSRANSRSESKGLVGHKRKIMEAEETSESSHKSVKGEARIETSGVSVSTCIQEGNKFLSLAKEEKSRGFYLDLNAEDTSSSIKNDNLFDPFNNFEHVKSRDDSLCESSMNENNPGKLWEGLKRNNFMSAPRGVVPAKIPKPRGRKKRDDVMKKKMELARKEQIDRFAKVAAPSGLLNGLNPGIINHVRNSKQVHSIIESLVRSETIEKNRRGEHTEREGPLDIHTSYLGEKRIHGRMPSHYNHKNKDDNDELELKLSSSYTFASENASCLSNEESGNLSVNSLSSKAANIASQWLELLNHDISGRLSALRQSKKRVRTVVNKELPLLTSKEFSSNVEKDSCERKDFILCDADKAHADRWTSIFEQMEKSLSEEESILDNWLDQVNKMQLHCERGLSNSLYTISEGTDRMGSNGLWEAHNSDKDLAVRAAAASIYSTCNFLLTMGNQSCC